MTNCCPREKERDCFLFLALSHPLVVEVEEEEEEEEVAEPGEAALFDTGDDCFLFDMI